LVVFLTGFRAFEITLQNWIRQIQINAYTKSQLDNKNRVNR